MHENRMLNRTAAEHLEDIIEAHLAAAHELASVPECQRVHREDSELAEAKSQA